MSVATQIARRTRANVNWTTIDDNDNGPMKLSKYRLPNDRMQVWKYEDAPDRVKMLCETFPGTPTYASVIPLSFRFSYFPEDAREVIEFADGYVVFA
jgi:hypothetical protein